jgi:PPOX class probable FMN-dependent enzyme
MPAIPADLSFIQSEAALRALHPAPLTRATGKVLTALDAHCRRFLELSSFCVVATQGPAGTDVSPRGDPPGFARPLDDRTLLLPDRVGNNRLDAMTNLLANPRIGLLFLVPGFGETLRINGAARITDDARLLAPCAINGRPPRVALLVAIEEAFLHCPKAFARSALWDPARHVPRETMPTYSQMLLAHTAGLTAEENARQDAIMASRGLY